MRAAISPSRTSICRVLLKYQDLNAGFSNYTVALYILYIPYYSESDSSWVKKKRGLCFSVVLAVKHLIVRVCCSFPPLYFSSSVDFHIRKHFMNRGMALGEAFLGPLDGQFSLTSLVSSEK